MMFTSRITIFLIAAGFFGMASFVSAKEKAAGAVGTSEYDKGDQLFDSGQYEPAVTEFTKDILANDKQHAFYDSRGFDYIALERFQEAAADFSKAIEMSTNLERAYIGRAQ